MAEERYYLVIDGQIVEEGTNETDLANAAALYDSDYEIVAASEYTPVDKDDEPGEDE